MFVIIFIKQTRTTKAHAHARIPLAAFPLGEAVQCVGKVEKERDTAIAHGDSGPMNWLGASGLAGVFREAGRGGGSGGVVSRGAEGAHARPMDSNVDTPEKAPANSERNPFVERFLRDSCTALPAADGNGAATHEHQHHLRPAARRLSVASTLSSAQGAAGGRSITAKQHVDMLTAGERAQAHGELAALEESLRFLELDLVSLMERSRDDLYEIDFWRCAPEAEMLGARRNLHGQTSHDTAAPQSGEAGAREEGHGTVPQLAKQISNPEGAGAAPNAGTRCPDGLRSRLQVSVGDSTTPCHILCSNHWMTQCSASEQTSPMKHKTRRPQSEDALANRPNA